MKKNKCSQRDLVEVNTMSEVLSVIIVDLFHPFQQVHHMKTAEPSHLLSYTTSTLLGPSPRPWMVSR